MSGAKNRGMVPGKFWGLLRKPDGMPCLFGEKQDAKDNQDTDEYLVEVYVTPASALMLLRGRREMLRRREAEKKAARARPRVPDTQKRRRGTAVKITGLGPLTKALQEAGPKFRNKFERDLAQALGKGVRRAAPSRVRR